MRRSYYSNSIATFREENPESILGALVQNYEFSLEQTQRDAWLDEIQTLQNLLKPYTGSIYFEYAIPRMGRRIDVLLVIGPVIFVLEFKVGEKEFKSHAIDQTWDYALDLKNFHETSHTAFIAPILIATKAQTNHQEIITTPADDKVLLPIKTNTEGLSSALDAVLSFADGKSIDAASWEQGRYQPTPTIIEAATALYAGHSVNEISRSDAGSINLSTTTDTVSRVIENSKKNSRKSICFVTGVPGAGKTLVGLNIATKHINKESSLHSVFLSGNGPLVAILREALTRDRVQREKSLGKKITKGNALREVKLFIQNVHNFRDECLADDKPPLEHVALFDEAQRAWDLQQTSNFMRRKKGIQNFEKSEPEFLISCLDRHSDWAVVICLVGGGQEIHLGESGISEWVEALQRSYKDWDIYISSRLHDSEYSAGEVLDSIKSRQNVSYEDDLHLAVSMRSFRAEHVSLLVKQILDIQPDAARETLTKLGTRFPIILTRDIQKAKLWLRDKARGSERYGMVASSRAQRLRPHAIHVKAPMDPIHWFLDGKDDIRSSFYLEDVATEFHVQGLELDWACVTWDGDFRYSKDGWEHRSFTGNKWQRINKPERQIYLKNAYRVLLTRARQGMVIVVPEGDSQDPSRSSKFYDPTFKYLRGIGFQII
ncbi:DUF2075 domain-containing protein [Elusimicrobiota bacterium]